MENRIKISDFAKLTGSTLKTIIYYHKIGLLQEPKRSSGGYRLYGSEELARMRLIKHYKSLGLDLKKIKEMLGDIQDVRTLREVLQSLRVELLDEIKSLEARVAKIDMLLSKETELLNNNSFGSPSFQMITEILEPDQIDKYHETCPELFESQRKIFGILDDYKWCENYQGNFRALAEYFKEHPQQYQISLNFGKRLAKLAELSEDDPEVEILAWESAEFIKSIPELRELLYEQTGLTKPLESLYNEMITTVLSPAQMKHKKLIQQYLNYKSK
ncbi:MAG TPA: MerR family transcriptional regulator [Clostridia bacterium]